MVDVVYKYNARLTGKMYVYLRVIFQNHEYPTHGSIFEFSAGPKAIVNREKNIFVAVPEENTAADNRFLDLIPAIQISFFVHAIISVLGAAPGHNFGDEGYSKNYIFEDGRKKALESIMEVVLQLDLGLIL